MSTMVHVHRLPPSTTGSELHKLFDGAGRVINCDVVANGSTQASRVIGFVQMATEEEARRAIDQLNGKELAGRVIQVSEGL
jgi:RNA recognition motif-containing protein